LGHQSNVRKIVSYVTLAFAAVSLLCATSTETRAQQAGRALANRLIENTVQIRARWEGTTQFGFGFIVGENEGTLYIVTANHVVRGNTGPGQHDLTPTLTFQSQPGLTYQGKLVETPLNSADLAIVTIEASKVPNLRWIREAITATSTVVADTEVWSVGAQQRWAVPDKPGTVRKLRDRVRPEYSGTTIVTSGLTIVEGASGAPLISQNGIVGMIVSTDGQEIEAIPIETIESIVKEWRLPWNIDVITPVQECDRLAADPYDLLLPPNVAGVELTILRARDAEKACFRPFFNYGVKIPRFIHQMARALEAENEIIGAKEGYSRAAASGYAASKASLGVLYEKEKKDHEAADLFRDAAKQNNPIAQTHLANILRDGAAGLANDDITAVELYKAAAVRGYPLAISGLAWMHEQGRGGLKRSDEEAIKLYQQAAGRGDAYAQRALKRFGL
jgi:TPR repeat protein